MAITLNADRSLVRLTTDDNAPNNGQQLPSAVVLADITNPGPMIVHTTQDNAAGQCIIKPGVSASAASYWGYNIKKGVKAGKPAACYKGVVVEGFLGATPGSAVYIDATSAEASADASGLTHVTNTAGRIGVAMTATRIRFD
jgi:hypothetical protein